jgi:hypothetical protein
VTGELVNPVVVRLAQRERQMRIHVVACDQAQARGRIEYGDIDPFDRHAHHLRLTVVLALDREIEPVGGLKPRAGKRL